MKNTYLFSFISLIFLSSSLKAQISGAIADIDTTNDVTAISFKVNALKLTSSTVFWNAKTQYKTSTGQWQSTDTLTSISGSNYNKTITGLAPATDYWVRVVFYTAAFADSNYSQVKTVRTKAQAVAPEITYVKTIPGLPKSKIVFTYKSSTYQSMVVGSTNTFSPIGDTVYVAPGSGTDTLFIANSPNQQIPGGSLFIFPQGVSVPAVQSNSWPAFVAPSIVQPSVSVTNKNQTKYQTSFDVVITTNGSYQESIVDSLVLFENGTEFLRQGIWVTNTQTFPIVRTGKKAGTTYSYSGYVKNRFGHKVPITGFSITTLPADQGFKPIWGNNLVQSPTTIECFNIGYTNVASGKVLLDVRKKGTQNWETFSSGQISGTGNISSILVSGCTPNTTYELRLRGMSVDSLILTNSDIREITTFAALPPSFQKIVINGLVNNTVTGVANGDGNGTETTGFVELYENQNGNMVLQDVTTTVSLGTDAFDLPFVFQNLNYSSYEVRAIISENGVNPKAISKFFTNTISGVEEVSTETFLETVLWNLYDINGQLVGTNFKKNLLKKEFGKSLMLLSPVDAGFKKYTEKRIM